MLDRHKSITAVHPQYTLLFDKDIDSVDRDWSIYIYSSADTSVSPCFVSAEQNVATKPEKVHIPSQSAQTTVCSVLSIMQIA